MIKVIKIGGNVVDNPELLKKMVHETNAKSTDLESPETVEHLCEKCEPYAENWQPSADEIWDSTPHKEPAYTNYEVKQ